jgi:SAM-dependent methyltransferase
MDPEEYAVMFEAEGRHWWYLGMERITRALLDRWCRPALGLRILDAGCGTGAAMTSYLGDYGRVTGFDLSPEAVKFSARRGAGQLVQASVIHIPFTEGCFDLAVSFDVLYERGVPDDLSALRELHRVLAPGGRLLIRLPAYDWLRGRHDAAVHSRHRYTRPEVVALLGRAGFEIVHASYANTILFPAALAKRLAERWRPPRQAGSDLTLKVGLLNRLFAALLASEAPFVAGPGLPFGLSVVAVGCKP